MNCTKFPAFTLHIYAMLIFDLSLLNFQFKDQQGLFTARVDGKTHEFIFSTRDDVCSKRRHILSPAFSAHKMKLVGEGNTTVRCMHAPHSACIMHTVHKFIYIIFNIQLCECYCTCD